MSSSSDSEDGEEAEKIKASAIDMSTLMKSFGGLKQMAQNCEQQCNRGQNSSKTYLNDLELHMRDNRQQLLSKRPDKLREEEPEHELQTTPEFRSFVAKKLASIIDSAIKIKPKWTETCEEHDTESGIQLFSSSKPITSVENNRSVESLKKKSKKKKRISTSSDSSDTSDNEAGFASVAVSGDSIIQQSSIHNLDKHQTEHDSVTQRDSERNTVPNKGHHNSHNDHNTGKAHKKKRHHTQDS